MFATPPQADGCDEMTDARYPERWLNDKRVKRLSDRAHRVFITSMAWCASNRTDGLIEPEDLGDLPIVPDRALRDELVKSGLWSRTGQNILHTEYESSQTTRDELAQLETARAAGRRKKARQRARRAAVPGDVPGDAVPPDHTGQERQGQARTRGREATERAQERWSRGYDD